MSLRTAALLITGGEGYGVGRSWRTIAAALPGRGFRPLALSVGDGALVDALRDEGTEVLSRGRRAGLLKGGVAGKLARLPLIAMDQVPHLLWVVRRLREARAEALFTSAPDLVPLAAVAGRIVGVKSFWLMANDVSSGYPLDLNRRVYAAAIGLGLRPIANSRWTLGTLGKAARSGAVVHRGVPPLADSPEGEAITVRAEVGAEPGDAVFAICARLTPDKGQDVFIQALERARPGLDGVRLLIVGGPLDTPFARRLAESAAASGGRIRLLGPRDDVPAILAASDVPVNSRLGGEPFGLSVIEGLRAGRPVLAHRLGGPGETVRDGETGWLVNSPTVEAFEGGVRRALADRPRWSAMGEAARRDFAARFTDEAMMDALGRETGLW